MIFDCLTTLVSPLCRDSGEVIPNSNKEEHHENVV